ncbi:MAG: hypothetical protein F7C82_03915 [Desulfurococcales archaeon]|nr:hypothetical protein [Desulfurococcales archaeon]MCE4622307.1 hypothetical protein [Desulfurococcales archaeon]MCE4626935.1 hypothetical protein [Desulfurococcales archaeon]MCE4629404.1 hypothetical protein [Desulfurococcales archaeon]
MSEEIVSLERILEWLKKGKDKPETFVDLRWEIIKEERGADDKLTMFVATHQAVPVQLLVLDLERMDAKMKVIRLAIESNINTIDLPPEAKIVLYRFLLNSSKLPLVKFYLFGENHQIAIATDLDKRLLSKEEFEEALAALLLGYMYLGESLPDQLREKMLEASQIALVELVQRWYERGVDREEALKNLVKAGFKKEEALKLLSLVYRPRGESPLTM